MQNYIPFMDCARKPHEQAKENVYAAIWSAAASSDPNRKGWEENGDEEEIKVAAGYHGGLVSNIEMHLLIGRTKEDCITLQISG